MGGWNCDRHPEFPRQQEDYGMPNHSGRVHLDHAAAGELPAMLRHHAEKLPAPDQHEDFAAPFDRFADAKVVLLGEATHGTSEFYQARSAITRRLIAKHGFTIVAVEADWPDAARIDRYVRHLAARPGLREAFQRFPAWMWRNAEVLAFIE